MLDREELAARFAIEYAVRNGFHPEDAARQGLQAADALLAALASKPAAPVPVEGLYVPKVGDVVRVTRPPKDDYDEWKCFLDADWYDPEANGIVVASTDFYDRNKKVPVNRLGRHKSETHGIESCRLAFVRPATAAERAAAGLPVEPAPVPPVDPVREAERAVVEAAERYVDGGTIFEVDCAVATLCAARKAKS